MNSPVQINNRRELFIDDYLIDTVKGNVSLRLHPPVRREIAFRTNLPWEGSMCAYMTVFQDEGLYRMYYNGWEVDLDSSTGDSDGIAEPHPMWVCYAESNDGINWRRPELGLIHYKGSSNNNILWKGPDVAQHGVHGFAPFKDSNPNVEPESRYKAVGADRKGSRGTGLYAMKSPDGIDWSLLQKEPILQQKIHGTFDCQNLAFWDSERSEYRIYFRDYRYGGPPPDNGRREIKTASSVDFINWTEPKWVDYSGLTPHEMGVELYTNQIMPYPRAPHIFIGFPSRYVFRPWSATIEALPEAEHRRWRANVDERFGTALTDTGFMCSRDGFQFKLWEEAFIRPGPQLKGNWSYGDNDQCWGMIETPSSLEGAPPEFSFFTREDRWRNNDIAIRRHTIRKDGFGSFHSLGKGGEVITKPLIFQGEQLTLNMSTSITGGIRVEIQNDAGQHIRGYSLDDCDLILGDELERVVTWNKKPHLSQLAGVPVRLRITLQDADLYAIKFISSCD